MFLKVSYLFGWNVAGRRYRSLQCTPVQSCSSLCPNEFRIALLESIPPTLSTFDFSSKLYTYLFVNQLDLAGTVLK